VAVLFSGDFPVYHTVVSKESGFGRDMKWQVIDEDQEEYDLDKSTH
jgi:hypothetical protein